MEILNYKRLDKDSKRSAYTNPNLDQDFRRLLESINPELTDIDETRDIGGDDGNEAKRDRLAYRQQRAPLTRSKGYDPTCEPIGKVEMAPLMLSSIQEADTTQTGIDELNLSRNPPKLSRQPDKVNTIMGNIMTDARFVTGTVPDNFEQRLLDETHKHNLNGILRLVRENRYKVRLISFEVPDSRGKVFTLPFFLILVLYDCLNRDDRQFEIIAMILRILFEHSWRSIQYNYENEKLLNTMAQWEIEPGFFTNVSVLHLACFYGNFQMVHLLDSFEADLNAKSENGDTPLLFAMNSKGNTRRKIVEFLLRNGANANECNIDGTSPLHKALSSGGDAELIRLLIYRGKVKINACKRRGLQTPLIQAVSFRELGMVKLLLDCDADVFHTTPKHQTALHYAVVANKPDMAKLLMENADNKGLNTLHNSEDLDGNSPFMLAAIMKNTEIMRILLECGASLDMVNLMGKTAWDYVFPSSGGNDEMLDLLIEFHLKRVHTEMLAGKLIPVVPLSPLHVATRRDNVKLLKILINKGIDCKESDNKRMDSFLHVAAAENKKHVIAEAFPNYDDLLQAVNRNLDTPLHMVSRYGNANTAQIMMDRAQEDLIDDWLHLKNLQKITPFYVAMLRSDQNVANAIAEKMQVIRDTDVDLNIAEDVDSFGNTYLHLAARKNFCDICEKLMKLNININLRNAKGNTALHEAAQAGQLEAVECLLRLKEDGVPATPADTHQTTADLHLKNHKNRSALHCAAKAYTASGPLLECLVRVITKVDPAGVIMNEADDDGNTALHLAIRRGSSQLYEIITALRDCNFELCNNQGDTPLHTAAKNSDPSVLLAVLNAMDRYGLSKPLNVCNNDGRTVLMLCMENGHSRTIGKLIRGGTNLAYRSLHTGDTALHHLLRLSVQQPQLIQQWVAIYFAIVDNSVKWWCNYNEVEEPDDHSKYYLAYKEIAVKFLTFAVRSTTQSSGDDNTRPLILQDQGVRGKQLEPLLLREGDGLTVIQLAVALGASKMLETIYRTRKVYKTSTIVDGIICPMYDVTYITPDTSKFGKAHKPHDVMSVVESLAYMDDESKVVEFLDITPIRQLSENYWARYQWIFVVLMIAHIIYMSLLSYYGLQLQLIPSQNTIEPLIGPIISPKNQTVYDFADDRDLGPYSLLLAWPIVLFLYLSINLGFRIYSWVNARRLNTVKEAEKEQQRRFTASYVWSMFIKITLFQREIITISGIVFSLSVILWFVFLADENVIQLYFMVISFCLGWVFTVAFTKGFETVNAFSIMLKYIIVIDIFRFFFVFVFIFLGFSLAMQAMFLHTPTYAEEFSSVWYTYFYVFRIMLAVDDPFTDEFDEELKDAGISTGLPKVTYIVFMVITAIVLLNLLIAMMSDTYSKVMADEATHWRVSNVKLAIGLEKQLRRLKHWLRFPVHSPFKLSKSVTNIHPKSKYGAEFHVRLERYFAKFPHDVSPTHIHTQDLNRSVEDQVKDHIDEKMANIGSRLSKVESSIEKLTSLVTELSKRLRDSDTE